MKKPTRYEFPSRDQYKQAVGKWKRYCQLQHNARKKKKDKK